MSVDGLFTSSTEGPQQPATPARSGLELPQGPLSPQPDGVARPVWHGPDGTPLHGYELGWEQLFKETPPARDERAGRARVVELEPGS